MIDEGWIGVDLDGTLAKYTGWSPNIGEPIPLMVDRVKTWIHQQKKIKIFTARIADPTQREEQRSLIEIWCIAHLGKKLEITYKKDHLMIELWDDRAVQIIPNTG